MAIFDNQAARFETSNLIPGNAAKLISEAIFNIVHPEPEELIIEIGGGTGAIGCELSSLPCQYICLEQSLSMIKIINKKAETRGIPIQVICGDADKSWPFTNNIARAVFGSRVMHLLNTKNLIKEIRRVLLKSSGFFLIGRIQRVNNNTQKMLRKQMHNLLQAQQITGVNGQQGTENLMNYFVSQGAIRILPRIVTEWNKFYSLEDSLVSWSQINMLGGQNIDNLTKCTILENLKKWIHQNANSLEQETEIIERYVLEGVKIIT